MVTVGQSKYGKYGTVPNSISYNKYFLKYRSSHIIVLEWTNARRQTLNMLCSGAILAGAGGGALSQFHRRL
jgi:hypothetical protein